MKTRTSLFLIILAAAMGCFFLTISPINSTDPNKLKSIEYPFIHIDTLYLLDTSANRPIPILLYAENIDSGRELQVAIIAPGHGVKNSEYAYIATSLAAKGYVVASIQYELVEDEDINLTGNILELLKPVWEQSVKSILYVTRYLKDKHPNLDCQHLTLIGHSRGGDIVMLFAQKYPELVSKVISLDNGHMPLLRTKKPKVFSLRANNTNPDNGVLPTAEEQEKYLIQIVSLTDISHMDMCFGTEDQKREINRFITDFLKK